jgi:type IV secretory pathway VirB9-like protein
MKHAIICTFLLAAISFAAPVNIPASKPADPTPGEPKMVTMGQRNPAHVRVARGQATLIRLPEDQRVMNIYGGDRGEGGVWSVDAGKVPTRFLAVKPREVGIHTTLHIISNTGQEISLFLQEVTGTDSKFDAEVDASSSDSPDAKTITQVKWVPAEEIASCKSHETDLKAEVASTEKREQDKAAAAIADYQSNYPRKLFFGYQWDETTAERMGLQSAWSDDKFTYFRANKVLALYEINEDGKPSLIQYSYKDGLYTVPKILYDGYFAIGTKKENKVTFHREHKQ